MDKTSLPAKRGMKAVVKWLGCVLAVFSAGITAAASPDPMPLEAPLNPAFEQTQLLLLRAKKPYSAALLVPGTPGKGYLPSPVDRSHMLGQTPSVLTDARTAIAGPHGAYPPSYDLRTSGYVTSIKDQGQCGSCWTFSTIASVESNTLLGNGGSSDFSENHLNVRHGFDWAPCDGGTGDIAGAYMTRWGNTYGYAAGLVNESDDPYTSTAATSIAGLSPRVHLQEFLILPDRDIGTGLDGTDNTNYKYAIQNYGAVDVAMYVDNGMSTSSTSSYWNQANKAFYYNGTSTPNHEVALVGWDDNYAASNFSTTPPGNGAFIVKNQWGTAWGSSGYFYISYYDKKLSDAHVFRKPENTSNYTRSYLYDPFGQTSSYGYGSNTAWGANVFTAVAGETLQSIAFNSLAVNTSHEIYIYTGVSSSPSTGILEGGAVNTTGSFPYTGYHTVVLSRPVALVAGQKFAVVIKFTTPGYTYPVPLEKKISGYNTSASASTGQSYISSTGSTWTDLTTNSPNSNVNIRAFTAGSTSVPGAPTIGTATSGSAQATVSFTPPTNDGGSAITRYTVTSSPGGITGTGTTSPIAVTGLTNGTSYTFTVTATNSVGTGPSSAASNSVTPSSTSSTTGSLTTTFTGNISQAGNMFDVKALSANVTINRFDLNLQATAGTVVPVRVYYKTGGYSGNELTSSAWTLLGTYSVTSAGSGNPSSMTVGNLLLASGQTYGIYLTTTDGSSFVYTTGANTYANADLQVTLGAGIAYPFATAFTPRTWNGTIYYSAGGTSATVPGAPTIVAAAAGNGSATLSFTAPTSNGGAAISGYKATCGTTTVSGATSPITVAPLNNGTTYACTVKASNSVGDSAPSTAVSVTPRAPVALPSAPTIGTASGGDKQATVSFTPPTSDGGATITLYTVTSNPGGITATGTASPITVTGLTNGTSYTFTVTATNSSGTGPSSAASNSVTPPSNSTTQSLSTTFAGGTYGANGNMFDVIALSRNATINSFDLNLNKTAGTVVPVKVYYKTGGYSGYETTSSAWTLLGTYSVTSAGSGSPSSMTVGNLLLTSGQTYGIYLTATDGTSFLYTSSAKTYSNADLQVTLGAGIFYPFGALVTPRTWNGTIYYSVGASATVPTCTLSASPTTISSGATVTLTASCSPAATVYVWSNAACSSVSASCTVTPTATGASTYTVTGSNTYGAGNIASVTVTVGMGSNWTALPGASPSRPSLALNSGTGKTQMVVRAASDQLWMGNFNTSGSFEGWNQLPGASPSTVAQAWHPILNKMYMVVRSASDQLWLGTFNSAGSFEGWNALPGTSASPSPVALAWHPTQNKMYMVARSASDQLWLGTFDSAGSFEGWNALPGTSPTAVALAWHSTLNKMYMVTRSSSDQLWLGTFDSTGSFEGWGALPGTSASPSPVALAWHPTLNKMYMAARSTSDQLWQGTFSSTSGAFEGWSALSGTSPTAPVLAAGQSKLQLVVRSANDQLWSMLLQ